MVQSPPVFCKRGLKINTEAYIDLVQDNYAPYLQGLYPGEDFYFLQDGAPSHTSSDSVKALDKIFGKNKVIQNPPNSPDLNVLDYHTWNHMDQMVQKCESIKTLSDLKREVVLAYMNINNDEIKRSVLTWEKRLRACLAAGGDRFEYRL